MALQRVRFSKGVRDPVRDFAAGLAHRAGTRKGQETGESRQNIQVTSWGRAVNYLYVFSCKDAIVMALA